MVFQRCFSHCGVRLHDLHGCIPGLLKRWNRWNSWLLPQLTTLAGNTSLVPYYVALIVLLVFVFLPLLLLCPVRCFQQCLGHCGMKWLSLHIFMDAFQGCYKDETNGIWDCQHFPTIQLILCIALLTSSAITLNELFSHSSSQKKWRNERKLMPLTSHLKMCNLGIGWDWCWVMVFPLVSLLFRNFLLC